VVEGVDRVYRKDSRALSAREWKVIGMLRLEELGREWPEIYRVAEKLRQGADLSNDDREWLDDISRVSGWDEDDVAEDLKNLDRDPSEREL